MRQISQLVVTAGGRLYALCPDGTLWTAGPFEMGHPEWEQIETPPEGNRLAERELTLEEQAEKLKEKHPQRMVIGPGKGHRKGEKND